MKNQTAEVAGQAAGLDGGGTIDGSVMAAIVTWAARGKTV